MRLIPMEFRHFSVAIITAILSGLGSVSAASEPLRITVSLASKSVMAGELIEATLEITNTTKQPLELTDQLRNDDGWVSFELRDREGKRIVDHLGASRTRRLVRKFGNRTPQLEPGTSWKKSLMVGASATHRKSGLYALVALFRLSYGVVHTPGTECFVSEVKTPITVTRADRRRLQEIASELARTIVEEERFDERRAAAEALASMPEAVVLPIWQALVGDPALFQSGGSGYFLHQLSLLNSSAAANLLTEIWANYGAPDGPGSTARTWLVEMYQNGPASLRRHVGRIFLAHEGKLPPPKDTSIVIIE